MNILVLGGSGLYRRKTVTYLLNDARLEAKLKPLEGKVKPKDNGQIINIKGGI